MDIGNSRIGAASPGVIAQTRSPFEGMYRSLSIGGPGNRTTLEDLVLGSPFNPPIRSSEVARILNDLKAPHDRTYTAQRRGVLMEYYFAKHDYPACLAQLKARRAAFGGILGASFSVGQTYAKEVMVHYYSGDFAKAIETADALLKTKPAIKIAVEAHYWRMAALREISDMDGYEKAMNALSVFQEQDIEDNYIAYAIFFRQIEFRALSYMRSPERIAESLRETARAVHNFPFTPVGQAMLKVFMGRFLILSDRLLEAMDRLLEVRSIVALFPVPLYICWAENTYFCLGAMVGKDEDYFALNGVSIVNTVLTRRNDLPHYMLKKLLTLRAVANRMKKNSELAIQDFKDGLKIHDAPDLPKEEERDLDRWAINGLISLLGTAERYQELLEVLDSVKAREYPIGLRVFYDFNRARCLQKLGRHREALAAFMPLREDEYLNPDECAEASIAVVSAYRMLGDCDMALREVVRLESLMKANDDLQYPACVYHHGLVLFQQRKYNEARLFFSQVLTAVGNDGDPQNRVKAWVMLATTYFALGRHGEAFGAWDQVIEEGVMPPDQQIIADSLGSEKAVFQRFFDALSRRGAKPDSVDEAALSAATEQLAQVTMLYEHVQEMYAGRDDLPISLATGLHRLRRIRAQIDEQRFEPKEISDELHRLNSLALHLEESWAHLELGDSVFTKENLPGVEDDIPQDSRLVRGNVRQITLRNGDQLFVEKSDLQLIVTLFRDGRLVREGSIFAWRHRDRSRIDHHSNSMDARTVFNHQDEGIVVSLLKQKLPADFFEA